MKKYTHGEIYEIKRVLDKVCEVLETTDNDVSFEVSFLGVDLRSFDGKMIADNTPQEYAISDDSAYREEPFTEYDADRMIAELEVLSHFNRVEETDTTEEE